MSGIKRPLLVGCMLIYISAAATLVTAQSRVFQAGNYSYRVVTVVDNVQDPWSIAFLPDGDMLFTERPGRLRIVRSGVLDPKPIEGIPKVLYQAQAGLLDVVLHPAFATNRFIYFSYVKSDAENSESTVAVFRARFDGNVLTDHKEIFEARAWSQNPRVYGSRLAFDDQGYLFITVGDRVPSVETLTIPVYEHPAQDLMTHRGKIIRLHDDGEIPADNPFVGRADALAEIWSYGHRNPQGLVVGPEPGDVWATEHGPQGGDELNRIVAGKNYGWPVIGFGVQYGGARIHIAKELDEMQLPLQHWTPSIAPSGLMLYTGESFPHWQGNLFVGGLSGHELHRLPLRKVEGEYQIGMMDRPPLLQGFARIRDVRQGPDGHIYLAIDKRDGELSSIVRLEPVEKIAK